jgi:hypothetical protein
MKHIIGNVISLLITAGILWYVIELDKKECECAVHWNQRFIKYFSPIVIVFILVIMVIGKPGVKSVLVNHNFLVPIFALYVLTHLAYIINMVVYFIRLRTDNCECAEDWKQWLLIVPSIMFVITFIIGFYFGFKQAIQNKKI